MRNSKSFTLEAEGCLNALVTNCSIYRAFDPSKIKTQDEIVGSQYFGLWDTGASGTVITKKVVNDLGLKPTGMVEVCHAAGKSVVNTYAINISLPNEVGFGFINVTEGNLSGFDVLIGMDIITLGDFAVTNAGGKTSFSFRVPSTEKIDFVQQYHDEVGKEEKVIEAKSSRKVGRNEPCPCGSGKKYKNCHGRQ